ncbi:MAG: HD-GYP domain-containing protein [Bacillota bacterium]|nr:HD-GYP domain-containing protein [Bacillota bacterium]MDP4169790.1 HD-GYP domain-containing protein [Bacillota bacterium]
MGNNFESLSIITEEKRIVKWFLMLFYIVIFSFDTCYYFLIPKYILHQKVGFPSLWSFLLYAVILVLLPIVYLLNKYHKYYLVKYICFVSYMTTAAIVEIMTYYGSNTTFAGGNMVEVFLILFSPLFINNHYFWVVSLGSAFKYALVGIFIHSSVVIIPIIFIIMLSLMAFLLLNRFQGYVNAIKDSYYKQSEEIVKGIIATLELKDPYTKGHSERVAGYATSLAVVAGNLSEEELKSFNYACLLHDIGKINIPDHILMKPSKLSLEEFDIIKTHPMVGAEAVKNVNVLKDNISVIRSHHERWDGLGYPDKLLQDETPFLARVTAIADAFDAMTSSRSYRKALSVNEAYNRILEGKGTQFDPDLVEYFIKIFPEWVAYHENYTREKKEN